MKGASKKKFVPGWLAAYGSIAASSIAALTTGDPLLIGIGTAAGAAVGGRIDAITGAGNISESILRASGFRFEASLVRKMTKDFEGGILKDNAEILRSQKLILNTLVQAGALPETKIDPRIPSRIRNNHAYFVPTSAFEGNPSNESLELIRTKGEIVVDSQSIHLGLLAALKVISTDFVLPIRIVNSARQGADQLEKINEGNEEVDFYICADANMFLLGGEQAKLNYRYFSPCFWQPQFIAVPSGTKVRSKKRLVFPYGSSAQEQYLAYKMVISECFYNSIDSKPNEVPLSSVTDVFRELESNELMICWDPVISNVNPDLGHKIIESKLYKIGTSIYCHRRWNGIDKNSEKLRYAFLEIMISAWNRAAGELTRSAFRLSADKQIRDNLRTAITPSGQGGLHGTL